MVVFGDDCDDLMMALARELVHKPVQGIVTGDEEDSDADTVEERHNIVGVARQSKGATRLLGEAGQS